MARTSAGGGWLSELPALSSYRLYCSVLQRLGWNRSGGISTRGTVHMKLMHANLRDSTN